MFLRKFGIVLDDFTVAHTGSQHGEDVVNTDAGTLDAGLPEPFIRMNFNIVMKAAHGMPLKDRDFLKEGKRRRVEGIRQIEEGRGEKAYGYDLRLGLTAQPHSSTLAARNFSSTAIFHLPTSISGVSTGILTFKH